MAKNKKKERKRRKPTGGKKTIQKARVGKTKPRRKSARPRVERASAFTPPPAALARSSGFDCGSYPGDVAIRDWAANSAYSFVGFYFDAPCHTTSTFKTWSGKFTVIKAAGLGIALVYVGFQQDGCGHMNLTRAHGVAHGQDTATKLTAEGFPDGAVVFLDVEHYNGGLSAAMEAYIRGWISAILDSGKVKPGIYCPSTKANEILAAAEKEYAAHGLPGGAPAFWIVKPDALFDPASSKPTDSGVSFAQVWQGRLDISETHGGSTITIDQNVANSSDPSRPPSAERS
jgi:hypothetical protein